MSESAGANAGGGAEAEFLRAVNVTRDAVLAERAFVADTSETRKRGLLDRDGLDAGEGLWLVPCEWVHMFGMRFPIDIVVLDSKDVVVGVQANLRPGWVAKLFWGAHSTLELPVGTLERTGTRKGDVVRWEEIGGASS
jgi:uncharacterized membrane protein (UPF0127 family)